MKLGAPARSNSTRFAWGMIFFLILLFVALFWNEIGQVTGLRPAAQPENSFALALQGQNEPSPFRVLCFSCVPGFFLVFFLWMTLISYQALLPIDNIMVRPQKAFKEAYRTAWYLLFYILRRHGPAIFVRDGEQITTRSDEGRSDWPGVVVVDFNSAVVLEERNGPPGIPGAFAKLTNLFFQVIGVYDPPENPRICGSGIIFTRPRERIKGVVDLRKQFRLQPDVRSYTRDGIELYGNVWSITSVGMEADRLEVAFQGLPAPGNLRVVRMSTLPNGYQRVTSFEDVLDEEDQREIFDLWESGRLEFTTFDMLEPQQDTFRERVFAAVNSQAHSGGEVLPWTDLPKRVAVGFFREEMSHINYDELYDVRESGEFPLPGYKDRLSKRMRNNGILAFSLIQYGRPNSKSLQQLRQGQVYAARQLRRSRTRLLQNPKVLRDRGIRVIASGFGDLSPVNAEVYQQRLDAWKATWESDLAEQMANSDRKAMIEEGRAKVEAQQELWMSLSRLFEDQEYTEEALALRVLQALDQAAADPRTRALLPANTLGMLQYINTLLLPGGNPALPQANQLPFLPPTNGGTR